MLFIAIILFVIAIVLLIYSITLLMGKDGTLFHLFSKEEKSLRSGQKLIIYITTIVLFVASLVWLLNMI